MIPAKPPLDEKHRLESLRQYGVLDTPPEQALDDLTTLAAAICEAPIALISLVDEQRLWFKSRVGLEAAELPRDFSFCAHGLDQPDLFVVPDATQDARFADNPLVTGEPGIRFYAGALLGTPEGAALGALCVIDRVPRTLTPAQAQALRVLARAVMAQLELRRQTRDLAGSERLLRTIFDSEPECVKVLGPDGSVRMMNRAGLAMIEADSFTQVAGHCLYPLVAPEHREKFEALTGRVFRGDSGSVEYQLVGLKGATRWLETNAAPLRDERGEVVSLLGIARDITARKQNEALLNGQKQVLEMIAVGRSLVETLATLLRVIEAQSPEMLCSLLLLDPDGVHLRHGASPSLPEAYMRAIDGVAIGANVGSCGTAAFRCEQVIVEDIATDPLWADYRDAALPHGLRACWSTPILDEQQRVLGTFAIYYRQPRRPAAQHLRLIDIATQTAAIAISRERAEQKIHAQLDELRRWQEVTLGREDRVMELKREVNELRLRLGEPARYTSQTPP